MISRPRELGCNDAMTLLSAWLRGMFQAPREVNGCVPIADVFWHIRPTNRGGCTNEECAQARTTLDSLKERQGRSRRVLRLVKPLATTQLA